MNPPGALLFLLPFVLNLTKLNGQDVSPGQHFRYLSTWVRTVSCGSETLAKVVRHLFVGQTDVRCNHR